VLSDNDFVQVPPVPVTVVDTTGAGDAFNSGLAVALAEGKGLIQAVQYGNCAGALACTRLGVIPALAMREAVDALYVKHFG
jgi:ribokinase